MSNKRETPAKQLLESLRKRQKEGGGLVLNIEILMDLAEVVVQYEKMAIMEAFIDGKYFYRKGDSKKRAEDYYNEKYN
jgi:hypothetical protein